MRKGQASNIFRRFWGFSIIVLLILVLTPLLYPPARQWPAQVLTSRTEPLEKADAIVLLMGDITDRTPIAAELWKRGSAPKIVLVNDEMDELQKIGLRPSNGKSTYEYLQYLGVPREAIIFNSESTVTSTIEEAQAMFGMLDKLLPGARHLIICTSWYHSSRAAWIIRRINLGRYQISSFPSPEPKVWYGLERDFLSVFTEYLKWIYYLLHY